MQVDRGEPSLWARGQRPVVVTIGSFDGVHIGHQALIRAAQEHAGVLSADSTALTFDPHPRCVVDPEHCPASITTLEEKLALFEQDGLDRVVVFPFNAQTRQWSAAQFCDSLAEALDLKAIVVGEDFQFGRGREGNIDFLNQWGSQRSVATIVVPSVSDGGTPVSSTRIRQAVSDGDVVSASRWLGRPFFIDAEVVGGEKVGTGLGFPTANLEIAKNKLIPGDGVYAGGLKVGDAWHDAAISIGTRPTFSGTNTVVEAFVLGFAGDLYGQQVRCGFIQKTRDQRKFDSAEQLAAQMQADVAEISSLLEKNQAQAL